MDISGFTRNNPLKIFNEIDKKATKNNPFYESAIIPPPHKDNVERVDKFYRYVIDSRDRNTRLYPSPSKYTIELDEDLTDVNSLELIVADVPFSRYLVHENNNVLHIHINPGLADDPREIPVVVPPGDYAEIEFAAVLQDAITATFIENLGDIHAYNPITVVYHENTKKFTIRMANAFTLVFKGGEFQHTNNIHANRYKENTMARLIGFQNEDVIATMVIPEPNEVGINNQWETTSKFRANFTADKYMVLKVNNVTLNKGQSTTLQSSFSIINNPDMPISNYYDHIIKKKLSPPLTSLKKLSIAFYDYDGNLYDFQNHEHRLELLFGTLNQTILYHDVVQNNFM